MTKLMVFIILAIINSITGAAVESSEKQFGFFVGGYMPIAVNDVKLLEATDFVVNKVNFAPNNTLGNLYYRRDKVLFGMRQLVAGFNYKVAFLMDQTNCDKNETIELDLCIYKSMFELFNPSLKKLCIASLFQSFPTITGENDGEEFQVNGVECY